MASKKLMECVPNFSEGNDTRKINAIADAIRSVPGAALLHIDISPAANRSVMTFAGEPGAVAEAAFRAIQKAAEVIDMRQQTGVHPRIGATDVCPLVPLTNMSLAEVDVYAKALGKRVGDELNIPVYLYEYSAVSEHRRALPDIRKGQYEGFAAKINLPEWLPDAGPAIFTPATGATVIGARDILVAFNISIDTQDVDKAVYIANRVRERGYMKTVDGKKVRVPGLLQKVRAIGWYMQDYQTAQVSMNLLDYKVSSPLEVWNTCNALANEAGVKITGSEVIGLIPEACLLEAGTFVFMKEMKKVPAHKEQLVNAAIRYMGLDTMKSFVPVSKVLEYTLLHQGLI